MFWGDDKLKQQLPKLIDEYDAQRMSSASYHLTVGSEVYVSPSGTDDESKPKTILEKKQGFMIPPGQFGLILCEEVVKVPRNAIAFISIRARYKFKGLVNVSGFHVDPGYCGRLMFSVYNAGSNFVHLTRGEECFVIWYADVNSDCVRNKPGINELPSEFIGSVAHKRESIDSISERLNQVSSKVNILLTIAIVFAGILGTVIGVGLREIVPRIVELPPPLYCEETHSSCHNSAP